MWCRRLDACTCSLQVGARNIVSCCTRSSTKKSDRARNTSSDLAVACMFQTKHLWYLLVFVARQHLSHTSRTSQPTITSPTTHCTAVSYVQSSVICCAVPGIRYSFLRSTLSQRLMFTYHMSCCSFMKAKLTMHKAAARIARKTTPASPSPSGAERTRAPC